MFKSYELRYSNSGESTIKIIDTDFEEIMKYNEFISSAFIKCYESRNMSVAGNLLLFFQYREKLYQYPIERQILWIFNNDENYKKYHGQVQKLLILI